MNGIVPVRPRNDQGVNVRISKLIHFRSDREQWNTCHTPEQCSTSIVVGSPLDLGAGEVGRRQCKFGAPLEKAERLYLAVRSARILDGTEHGGIQIHSKWHRTVILSTQPT